MKIYQMNTEELKALRVKYSNAIDALVNAKKEIARDFASPYVYSQQTGFDVTDFEIDAYNMIEAKVEGISELLDEVLEELRDRNHVVFTKRVY